ncbi:uncharacterized protein LOC133191631 [Saccostrea echinata]|uniref:uncharacterized protein LOC133191631 n=1 Tax=Saccostrea echinata TaxID=191078 RepID=UPI002A83217C|nr:uncharacterized protein LOC133191631 [Saccostrea echinata]
MQFTAVHSQCDSRRGTEGTTQCVSSIYFHETKQEPAVCLKKSTINSLARHIACRDRSADYCWYYCSLTPNRGGISTCQCDSDNSKSIQSVVPLHCYIPSGKSCSWYRECLETRIPCESTNYKYAITYAEKYCELYEQNYASFSLQGKTWVDAVRKCLQEGLVYALFPKKTVSCENLKAKAFLSHIDCYQNPAPDVRFCDLSLSDQMRVFWTIKGALLNEFRKTVSSGWTVLRSCISESYPQKSEKLVMLEIESTNNLITEEKVENITKHLSRVLGWSQDIMYAFAGPDISDSQAKSVSIKIFISSQSKSQLRLDEAINSLIQKAMPGTSIVLTLDDGSTVKIIAVTGCNDPQCMSTSFAFRTNDDLRKGLCACVTKVSTAVNGRKQATTSSEIGGRLRKGSCYKIVDGPSNNDDYTWHQLTHYCWTENLWVANSYLEASLLSYCNEPICPERSKSLACQIINNTQNITLRDYHPSGVIDEANPRQNIIDTCSGHAACRSMYNCTECAYLGAPGGYICLQENMLTYINELGKTIGIEVQIPRMQT